MRALIEGLGRLRVSRSAVEAPVAAPWPSRPSQPFGPVLFRILGLSPCLWPRSQRQSQRGILSRTPRPAILNSERQAKRQDRNSGDITRKGKLMISYPACTKVCTRFQSWQVSVLSHPWLQCGVDSTGATRLVITSKTDVLQKQNWSCRGVQAAYCSWAQLKERGTRQITGRGCGRHCHDCVLVCVCFPSKCKARSSMTVKLPRCPIPLYSTKVYKVYILTVYILVYFYTFWESVTDLKVTRRTSIKWVAYRAICSSVNSLVP